MIHYEITAQNYELIRDRITVILGQEFENQAALLYNTDCEGVDFYSERIVQVDREEGTVINVSLAGGTYANKHTGNQDGTYTYYIDAFSSAKTTSNQRGDTRAGLKAQRAIGICRAILENPLYKTLSFPVTPAPGFIMKTMITGFEMFKMEGDSAGNSRVARITFEVRANENIEFPDGNILTDAVTQVKLGISDKGLRYVYGTDAPSPSDDRYVTIVDQDDNVLYLLSPPARFTVEQLQDIIDTITDNTTSIIDPLT